MIRLALLLVFACSACQDMDPSPTGDDARQASDAAANAGDAVIPGLPDAQPAMDGAGAMDAGAVDAGGDAGTDAGADGGQDASADATVNP